MLLVCLDRLKNGFLAVPELAVAGLVTSRLRSRHFCTRTVHLTQAGCLTLEAAEIEQLGAARLAGAAGRSRTLRDAGLGCATAHLTSAGAREIVYRLIARDRPRLSPDDPFRFQFPGSRDWNAHSFFSGHIANSMGCASFFAHRFHLRVAEPVAYTLVTAIGIGRVLDGRHWLSDTVVGGLFGYATGRAINARMMRRERSASSAPAPLAVSFSLPFD